MATSHSEGTRVQDRFTVAKPLDDTPSGSLYLVRDRDGSSLLMHEISLEGFPAQAVVSRRAWIRDRTRSFARSSHPLLLPVVAAAYEGRRMQVVHEHADGLSPLRLSRMTLGHFSPVRSLSWIRDLCDLLLYLHARPRPLHLASLGPDSILVTPGEELRVLDPGLGPEAQDGQVQGEHRVLREEIASLGRLLAWLLTGVSDATRLGDVPSEIARLVSRCLDDRCPYEDLTELRQEVDRLLRIDRNANPGRRVAPASQKAPGRSPSHRRWSVSVCVALWGIVLLLVLLGRGLG